MVGGWAAVEVLAHDSIEVKNIVRAKGATWSLKASVISPATTLQMASIAVAAVNE
jgi:hypothetical protein